MLIPPDTTIWTLGHSTRTWEEFLGLLRENGIELLVDVRHFPTSSRVPWASGEALSASLAKAGLDYEHLVGLGGYRQPRPDSMNTGWRNTGFRGYADHMEDPEFSEALERLLTWARERRMAVMCAEAVPWKCHRGLLSDVLVVRGVRVVHILAPGQTQEHKLTPFAKVHGGRVTYPTPRGKA